MARTVLIKRGTHLTSIAGSYSHLTQPAKRNIESGSVATWQKPSSAEELEETVESGDISFDNERNFPCQQ